MSMKMKLNGAAGLLVLLLALLSGCETATKAPKPGEDQAASSPAISANKPEALYKSNCMTCHGGNLQGKIGPSLAKIGGIRSQEQIADKIQNGKGGMPAFKSILPEEDIKSLSEWLADKK
ncbi:c-type cytochrome [Paenibacillus alba]|uniref:Cytochrome c n=1 Tax=Paenibacillus alba TaxID=1197127 RepID=A0ABU6GA05_9BACL|nr:cytochrome c [Paenibacillus alba]MEC0230097.1 cytochrome c [Paenibacillus alba]